MASRRVHLYLFAAQVCFGSLAVAGRMALVRLPPYAIVMTRMLGGAILFTLAARALGVWRFDRRDLARLAVLALLGVTLNQIFFMQGLARSTATNATVLGSTIPLFTAVFAVALGREQLRLTRALGIGVAFLGAGVLVGIEDLSTDRAHLLGSVFVLINAASYGLYLVLARDLVGRYHPITQIALFFTLGVVFVAPLGVPAYAEMAPLTGRDVATLAYLIAIPTLAAYTLVQLALREAEATLVASYIYLQPVFAAIGGALLLDERPTARTGLAALIIFAGVYLAGRPAPPPRQ